MFTIAVGWGNMSNFSLNEFERLLNCLRLTPSHFSNDRILWTVYIEYTLRGMYVDLKTHVNSWKMVFTSGWHYLHNYTMQIWRISFKFIRSCPNFWFWIEAVRAFVGLQNITYRKGWLVAADGDKTYIICVIMPTNFNFKTEYSSIMFNRITNKLLFLSLIIWLPSVGSVYSLKKGSENVCSKLT